MQPTAGLVEIEPSMAWNPSVVSGIGVVQNVDELYNDMHSYLASAGMQSSCCTERHTCLYQSRMTVYAVWHGMSQCAALGADRRAVKAVLSSCIA